MAGNISKQAAVVFLSSEDTFCSIKISGTFMEYQILYKNRTYSHKTNALRELSIFSIGGIRPYSLTSFASLGFSPLFSSCIHKIFKTAIQSTYVHLKQVLVLYNCCTYFARLCPPLTHLAKASFKVVGLACIHDIKHYTVGEAVIK